MGFDIGSLMNPMGMLQGLTGGGDDSSKTSGANGTSGAGGIQGVCDSFMKGDLMGGIQGIVGMCQSSGGQTSVCELMDPTMFMDPFTKQSYEAAMQAGYAVASMGGVVGGAVGGVICQPAGTTKAPTYEEQWANAVNELKDHFDLLDTASGIGGKDGIIGRCDLEAAAKNPGLPAELRAACRFLLDNPAAFNQLDVGAGIGECDGFIGKCDVDAAQKALPKKPNLEKAKPNEKTLDETKTKAGSGAGNAADLAKADKLNGSKKSGDSAAGGTTGTAGTRADSTDDVDEADDASDADEPAGTKGTTKPDANPFEGMSAEEIIDEVIDSLSDDMKDLATKIAKTDDADARQSLEAQLQKLMERRKEMYELLSNMATIDHSMAMTTINNIGRI